MSHGPIKCIFWVKIGNLRNAQIVISGMTHYTNGIRPPKIFWKRRELNTYFPTKAIGISITRQKSYFLNLLKYIKTNFYIPIPDLPITFYLPQNGDISLRWPTRQKALEHTVAYGFPVYGTIYTSYTRHRNVRAYGKQTIFSWYLHGHITTFPSRK